MESAISGACDSVAELKQGTKDLTTNQVPKGAVDALMGVKSALDQIQQQARAFDHKFAPSSDKSDTASGMAMKSLEETTNEARQRTMDLVERTQESFNAMQQKAMNAAGAAKSGVQVATGETLRVAEKVDEKVGASGAVGSVIGSVAGTVKAVDSRMHISETAVKVDATVTGGLGARLVNTGVEMAKETLDYVSQTVHQAKAKASKSETVLMGEQKAEQAMETVQHGMEKMGITGAAQSTKETAQSAMDKGGEMKDQVMEKGGQATEMAGEKAGEMKDKTVEGGEQAKDKAGDMKDAVMEKGGQAKDMAGEKGKQAKDKAGEMKDAAKEKGGQASEMAMEKGSQAAGKAGEMKDQTTCKAGEMKDKTLDKAGEMKDKAQETAESGKAKAQDTAQLAKGTAQDTAESAKKTASGHHGSHHKQHLHEGTAVEQANAKAQEALDKAQQAM